MLTIVVYRCHNRVEAFIISFPRQLAYYFLVLQALDTRKDTFRLDPFKQCPVSYVCSDFSRMALSSGDDGKSRAISIVYIGLGDCLTQPFKR